MIGKVPGAPTLTIANTTALAAAATVDENSLDIAPDGAVALDLSLPLASIHGAAAGRDVTFATNDRDAVTAVVIDARKLALQPTLALVIAGSPVTLPTLWIADEAALTSSLLSVHPLRVTASHVTGASLSVDGDITAALAHGALVIVRVGSHS